MQWRGVSKLTQGALGTDFLSIFIFFYNLQNVRPCAVAHVDYTTGHNRVQQGSGLRDGPGSSGFGIGGGHSQYPRW